MNQTPVFWFVFILLVSQSTTASSLGNHNKKFTPASEMTESDWSDVGEMKRVWEAAIVRIPEANGGYSSYIMKTMTDRTVAALQSYPTIIYLHGCSGVWAGTYTRINFLAKAGFAVIAPVSFARKKYPRSCNPETAKGGMYRGTLIMRQNDAAYAIANAKQLSWVDKNKIFLMGHSQGGVVVATFESNSETTLVNARVIEGWTCHAGWSEYTGIKATVDEPVFALVARDDPWFQTSWLRGDCGAYMNKNNGSRSIVLTEGASRTRHALLEEKRLQRTVLEFIHKYMR